MKYTTPGKYQGWLGSVISVLSAILLTVGITNSVFAQQPGDLDPTFGIGGKLSFGTAHGPLEYPRGFDIAVQPDGRIVVGGKNTIARFNPDGSFDTTFGNGTGQVGGCCYITSIALQSDGKIVTAGGYEADASVFWFVVARYNANGALDTSFGNNGQVVTPSSGYARSINIQSDGKIVVVGTHWYGQIHRYNSDGTLDSSFGGGDGIVDRLELGYSYHFYSSVVQEDGKIVAVGEVWSGPNYYDIGVFRFMPDGSVDTGFGSDGKATATVGTYNDSAYSVAIQSDGKIVVAGALNNVPGGPFETPNRDFALARFNSNGSLDTGFGTNGAVKTPVNTGDDAAHAVRFQRDGRIVVAGYSDDPSLIYDFAVVRFHTNGSLDTAFGGGDGITTVDFNNAQDRAYGMALDSQGRPLLGGVSNEGEGYGAFALARFIPNSGTQATVTVTNDSGAGSLRQAIADVAAGGTIGFDPSVFATPQTITLTTGQLVIDKDLTINGPGASHLSISGNNASRVFYVNSGVTASLNGLTIKNGRGGGGNYNAGTLAVSDSIVSGNTADLGGGFYNIGTLTVTDSTFSNNFAYADEAGEGCGGGIFNDSGTLTIANSTISGNSGDGGGGGICQYFGGTLTLTSSTVYGNSGGGIYGEGTLIATNSTISGNTPYSNGGIYFDGGGIANSGTLKVTNSTVWGNTAVNGGGGIHSPNPNANETLTNTIVAGNMSSGPSDIFGTIGPASHNLIGDAGSSGGIQNGVNGNMVGLNPMLGPLQNNGGPTLTHALFPGSPAINAGDNCVLTVNGCGWSGNPALPTDQRGIPRIGNVDIGAFEGTSALRRTLFDFDGDGRADVAVFRRSDSVWYLNSSAQGFSATLFGVSTDAVVPADYDGDSRTDVAVFRDGVWWWMNSSTSTVTTFQFGLPGDIPVPADYDGNGSADAAVFRPSDGNWYIWPTESQQFVALHWGMTGDRPVPQDYDGDGKMDVAVFRPSEGNWYYLRSSDQGSVGLNWSLATDKTLPADYDGDGKADPAVFRDGTWYVLASSQGSTSFQWGLPSDIPVPADYDGDGRTDAAIYRNGTWWILKSTGGYAAYQFGLTSDSPVPGAYNH